MIIAYLNVIQRIIMIENKNKEFTDKYQELYRELKLFEEKFKTIIDLSELKTKLNYIEKKIFKK